MENHNYDTVTEATNGLRKRGYTIDFNLRLQEKDLDKEEHKLHPDKFQIDEIYRFEGDTDPGDEMIVYAISSTDGKRKGILVNGFGANSDPEVNDIVRELTHVTH